ncbi:hypothetical protein [Dictyobacter aurantiacus]|uniref:Immunity protein 30 domain-containing protein n=1 Tax=Dictyobacter aurantiacus TaxID=1936993 RepID=A0A401ZEW6_9CHLR|nr:hypothetical protein [Dictyobacter aurantiacus]GCE05407.1 hypothetical protein KDAU_27360 [Dictyobacter aurantiacus]
MDIFKEIRGALYERDEKEKLRALQMIENLFEYTDLTTSEANRTNLIQVIGLLINEVLVEKNSDIRESILFNISQAITYNHTIARSIDWESLVANLSAFVPHELEYVLYFLGASKNLAYLALIKSYLNSDISYLSTSAKEAISDLTS